MHYHIPKITPYIIALLLISPHTAHSIEIGKEKLMLGAAVCTFVPASIMWWYMKKFMITPLENEKSVFAQRNKTLLEENKQLQRKGEALTSGITLANICGEVEETVITQLERENATVKAENTELRNTNTTLKTNQLLEGWFAAKLMRSTRANFIVEEGAIGYKKFDGKWQPIYDAYSIQSLTPDYHAIQGNNGVFSFYKGQWLQPPLDEY